MPDDTSLKIIRDAKGRILPGSPSPHPMGRPKREVAQRWRAAFEAECTLDELRAIVRNQVERAKAGSVQSTRLILDYTVGKPRTALDVTVTQRASLWSFILQARDGSAPDEEQAPEIIEG